MCLTHILEDLHPEYGITLKSIKKKTTNLTGKKNGQRSNDRHRGDM